MGVSGSGKSTVAGILADQLGWDLEEGDELHPAANVAKMHAGIPLTDDDRRPWLESVSCWITEHTEAGLPGIITCSALKRIYRDRLRGENVLFVHLAGTRDTIGRRLDARLDHFMPGILLESQIATLEPPGPDENTLVVDVGRPPAEVAAEIIRRLGLRAEPRSSALGSARPGPSAAPSSDSSQVASRGSGRRPAVRCVSPVARPRRPPPRRRPRTWWRAPCRGRGPAARRRWTTPTGWARCW